MRGHLLVLSVVHASHFFETKEIDGWELSVGQIDEDYELIAAPTAAADAAPEQDTDILFEDGVVLLKEMRGLEPNELTESLQEKIDRANKEFEDACGSEWMLQANFDKVTKEFLEANADDELKKEKAIAASEEVCESIKEKMFLSWGNPANPHVNALRQRRAEDEAVAARFREAYKLRLAEYSKFQEKYEADMLMLEAKQNAAIKEARALKAQLKK